MREGWSERTLGEVADVLDRMRRPVSAAEREQRPGQVPYFGATGQAGWIDEPLFNEELVLLGEDAIDFLNPLVHKAYLVSGPSWVNNHAHVLRANQNEVLSFVLMEALNRVDYSRFVAFGTRSKLTQGSMMGIRLQIPPLSEQRRIVDLMQSVDTYIESLQQQVEAARTARNAVLHDLLSAGGDDWTETTLGHVVQVNSENTRGFDSDDEITYIDLSSVSKEIGISDDLYRGTYSDAPGRARRVVRSQDVLIATVRPYLRGFAVIPTSLDGAVASTGFAVLRAVANEIRPSFLWAIVGMDEFVDFLMERATGSSYPAVRPDDIASFPVLLPPIPVQDRIGAVVSSFDEVLASSESALKSARDVRSGLLADLLSSDHEIPESYDRFLGVA